MGLRVFTERDNQGLPLINSSQGEEIRHVQPLTSLVLGCRNPQHPGTLFITTRRLIWLSDVDKEKGYEVDFLSLSLHAISRDPDAYPLPCIYTQIDTAESNMSEDEELEDQYSTNDDNVNLSQVAEMRIVPSDASALENIFTALCTCAELNPDPVSELDGEGDWIFNANDMMEAGLGMQDDEGEWEDDCGRTNTLGQSNGVDNGLSEHIVELSIDDSRFEDAMESENEN